MIQKLTIENFQSHLHTALELSPGVNVIVGPSDSGKTAIIRALRWLIWNRPSGESFRSSWGGNTSVSIKLEKRETDKAPDGLVVSRMKTNGLNTYRADQKLFEAFGSDVPEPIRQVLNMDETNLQMQLDAPFLISSSPGEVAAYFNRISHLEKIDTGLKNINSLIRSLDQKQGFMTEELQEVSEALEQFEYLDKAEVEIEVLEEMETRMRNMDVASGELLVLASNIHVAESDMKELDWVLELEPDLNKILGLEGERLTIETDVADLIEHYTTIKGMDAEIDQYKQLTELEEDVDTYVDLWLKHNKMKDDHRILSAMVSNIESNAERIITLQSNIVTAEGEFALELGDTCPLCNQPIQTP